MEASLLLASKSPPTARHRAEAPYLPLLPFEGCSTSPNMPFLSGPERTGCWPAYLFSPQASKRVQDGVGRPALKTWLSQYFGL